MSIGVATFDKDTLADAAAMLAAADSCLYAAKKAGRDCVICLDPGGHAGRPVRPVRAGGLHRQGAVRRADRHAHRRRQHDAQRAGPVRGSGVDQGRAVLLRLHIRAGLPVAHHEAGRGRQGQRGDRGQRQQRPGHRRPRQHHRRHPQMEVGVAVHAGRQAQRPGQQV
ncbi:conserved hypothetical protein [Ricinus communis]|uniref:GGDEF domain-containing protein n=1 Tax=Ricinus communis TaxID=3988 RepID=B9TMU7_RICCO|nr:conserved hypothetical protein [Ricinus communis]